MPFWNYFWLIVPAVTLLTLSVLFYIRTGHADSGRADSGHTALGQAGAGHTHAHTHTREQGPRR